MKREQPSAHAGAELDFTQAAEEAVRGNRGRSAVSGKQFFSARKILLALCLAAGLGALIAPAAAQVYPNRPVKIVVPFVPGGPTAFIIRLLADRLTAML